MCENSLFGRPQHTMLSFTSFFLVFLCFVNGALLEDPVCVAAGRVRSRDPTCRSYFLCAKSRGLFVARQYVCPETAIFNPSTTRCSFTAHCIEEICNSIPPSVTNVSDPNSSDCKTYIECVGVDDNRYPVVRRCDVGYFNKDLPGCCLTANC